MVLASCQETSKDSTTAGERSINELDEASDEKRHSRPTYDTKNCRKLAAKLIEELVRVPPGRVPAIPLKLAPALPGSNVARLPDDQHAGIAFAILGPRCPSHDRPNGQMIP